MFFKALTQNGTTCSMNFELQPGPWIPNAHLFLPQSDVASSTHLLFIVDTCGHGLTYIVRFCKIDPILLRSACAVPLACPDWAPEKTETRTRGFW